MHTTTNLYLVNLAVADVFITISGKLYFGIQSNLVFVDVEQTYYFISNQSNIRVSGHVNLTIKMNEEYSYLLLIWDICL